MKKITLLLVPDNANNTRSLSLPVPLLNFLALLGLLFISYLGYISIDYWNLRTVRGYNKSLSIENQHLKGEAKILLSNLEGVKQSLRRIQDYTNRLDELVNLKVNKVSKKVGIGPLSKEEFSSYQSSPNFLEDKPASNLPLGIPVDTLIFRPVLNSLDDINSRSHRQALELQRLLSTLSEKKSLLSSIPSLKPVRGWIASGFGQRISPFTGNKATHKGIDIAAPVGTPIRAPANGVVIFSGAKAGFGNFIMLAHYGYGIVTRYGHNAQNMVRVGQKVSKGTQIATVGMTGRTTGPHLHYEVWVNGRPVNPRRFILE